MAASWHRIVLLAVLALLAGVAGWVIYAYPGAVQDMKTQAAVKEAGNKVGGLSADAVAEQEEQWKNPPRWTVVDGQGKLFTSRLWLYFTETKKIQLSDDSVEIDGVPLKWMMRAGLDAKDPDVLNQDPDGDGFTNREEYLLKTDPRDPKSHPPYASLLRLQTSSAKKFTLAFTSVNDMDGGKVFQINTPQGHRGSYTVKAGDHFEGFTVGEFRPKRGPKKIGNIVSDDADISELDVKSDATGETLTLVYRDVKDVPEVTATFVLLLANAVNQPVTVAQGKDFTIQASPKPEIPMETLHYQFISADATGAKLLNPETKETVTVPLLKPEEMQRFAAPAPAPGAAP